MIYVENYQIIYLERRFHETTVIKANYWNKHYNPASYYAELNTEFGNLRYFPNNCSYKKAKPKHQGLTLQPNKIIFADSLSDLPESAGVYALFSRQKECLYVGASKNIRKRVPAHQSWTFDGTFFVAYWSIGLDECWDLERVVLASLHPKRNVQGRGDILPKWCHPLKRWKPCLWPDFMHD